MYKHYTICYKLQQNIGGLQCYSGRVQTDCVRHYKRDEPMTDPRRKDKHRRPREHNIFCSLAVDIYSCNDHHFFDVIAQNLYFAVPHNNIIVIRHRLLLYIYIYVISRSAKIVLFSNFNLWKFGYGTLKRSKTADLSCNFNHFRVP